MLKLFSIICLYVEILTMQLTLIYHPIEMLETSLLHSHRTWYTHFNNQPFVFVRLTFSCLKSI